jgi:hypothetical protein
LIKNLIKTVSVAVWVILMVSIAGGVLAMHAYY